MTRASEFGLCEIGQISVTVHDLERAVAFYRDALGIPFLFQVPKMAFFDCGGVRLMLGIPERAEFDHPSSVLYFRVLDIGAAHQELVARGVRFEGDPHQIADLGSRELWMAFFRDVDNNLLALMSEIAKA
ncbi:MAG: VOC family protein [Gemmatimonadetes bacterium]|nr:VOC family protein [Gemmatimonadota bacterium]